jgi:cation diffusion facilitator family transporter
MHTDRISDWTHEHVFDTGNAAAERSTRLVAWITAVMMVVEIATGWIFNSMALLADGVHMGSHAMAIGLSVVAYAAARRYARDPHFAFGTWKIEILAGFSSALLLLVFAAMMVVGSIERLISPQPIGYREAIAVAIVGLVVNVVSALILGHAHDHDDHHGHHHEPDHSGHGHEHEHDHARHEDLNLKAAYVHVIADAVTSILAIVALLGGWLYGWGWLDPVMGIVGALLITAWAKNLLVDTGRVLLDREMDHPVVDEIRAAVETGPADGDTHITDLHVWRVGKRAYACALSVLTHDAQLTAARLRERLAQHEEIVHATIEVQLCPQATPNAPG